MDVIFVVVVEESRATKTKHALKQAAPVTPVAAVVETASAATPASDDDEDVDIFGFGIYFNSPCTTHLDLRFFRL